jgi:hypothetical protein
MLIALDSGQLGTSHRTIAGYTQPNKELTRIRTTTNNHKHQVGFCSNYPEFGYETCLYLHIMSPEK